MSTEGETDTSRSVVKTYVPTYQKEAWQEEAESLEMSQSEYVRTMVQAGRRGFLEEVDSTGEAESGSNDEPDDETGELADRVQRVLSSDEYLAWEELLGAITEDIEDQLEETLADLQDDNTVRYSGRNGGYTLVS